MASPWCSVPLLQAHSRLEMARDDSDYDDDEEEDEEESEEESEEEYSESSASEDSDEDFVPESKGKKVKAAPKPKKKATTPASGKVRTDVPCWRQVAYSHLRSLERSSTP